MSNPESHAIINRNFFVISIPLKLFFMIFLEFLEMTLHLMNLRVRGKVYNVMFSNSHGKKIIRIPIHKDL